MSQVAQFLILLRDRVGFTQPKPKKITIDVSSTEHGAINEVYPDANVQWRLFHAARVWIGKTREVISLGSTNSNAAVHRNIITQLKSMMWEKDATNFVQKLAAFITGPKRWVAAFRPLVFTNMDINNYVESWHNQLKTVHLHRKRDRRVNRLVCLLVNDAEPNFIQNISGITLNIGRMWPEERRRRELDAEAINEAAVSTMIGHNLESNFLYV